MTSEEMRALLSDLQPKQYQHDLKAHAGVLGWDEHKQLTHFTLHIAKYTAAFALAWWTPGMKVPVTKLVDAFIICLAAGNLKRIHLSDHVCPHVDRGHAWLPRFPNCLLNQVGAMSKLCEGKDHGEKHDYDNWWRSVWIDTTSFVLHAAIALDLDLSKLTQDRWRQLEADLLK